jgi:hypothetical protein
MIGTALAGSPARTGCKTTSDNGTMALLELYTSEGCSSCPPADAWLTELRRQGIGAGRLIPLAFHVDYWNDLGWTDRFSQVAFSERQRSLARGGGARSVYTPALMLNGAEYRRRGSEGIERDIESIRRQPARADLSLSVIHDRMTARIEGEARLKASIDTAQVFVALVENNLDTVVRAGENNGRRLHHEAVVRALSPPFPVTAGKPLRFSYRFTLGTDWKALDLGVVAFVQSQTDATVLQALSSPLCD